MNVLFVKNIYRKTSKITVSTNRDYFFQQRIWIQLLRDVTFILKIAYEPEVHIYNIYLLIYFQILNRPENNFCAGLSLPKSHDQFEINGC